MDFEGLRVDILSNDLSGIVTVEDISYSDGIGFAYLKLKVDGVEAEAFVAPNEPEGGEGAEEESEEATETASDPPNDDGALMSGTVIVSVKDLSAGGLSS